MNNLLKFITMKNFTAMLNDDSGATMVEYALILSLVSIVSIVILTTLGTKVQAAYTAAANAI